MPDGALFWRAWEISVESAAPVCRLLTVRAFDSIEAVARSFSMELRVRGLVALPAGFLPDVADAGSRQVLRQLGERGEADCAPSTGERKRS